MAYSAHATSKTHTPRHRRPAPGSAEGRPASSICCPGQPTVKNEHSEGPRERPVEPDQPAAFRLQQDELPGSVRPHLAVGLGAARAGPHLLQLPGPPAPRLCGLPGPQRVADVDLGWGLLAAADVRGLRFRLRLRPTDDGRWLSLIHISEPTR